MIKISFVLFSHRFMYIQGGGEKGKGVKKETRYRLVLYISIEYSKNRK